jgi:hypothetical protein
MGVHPFGEPPHPSLLLDSLYGFRPIGSADPRNGLRRRHAREDGHARQYVAGATASAQTADLDEAAVSPSSERLHNLLRRKLWILRESEVLPVDHGGGPSRLPKRIEVEAERALRIVGAAVGDGRSADSRSVGEPDDRHPGTVRPHDRLGLAWAELLRREAPPNRIRVALAPNQAHTCSVPELLTALLIAILFATPWIGAIALVCWRAGARLLWSEADEVFPTQSSQWRGIGAR